MAQIQPISSWLNGQEQEATNFVLISVNDNLSTACDFTYQLNTTPDENGNYITLVSGFITMAGQDYQDWDVATNANQWAYEWAAAKLNLVLIPDQVIV